MILTRREHLQLLCCGLTGGASFASLSADPNSFSDREIEEFLRLAKIVSVEAISHGVTKPLKVKLELNGVRHSAQIQTVDKEMPDFFPPGGTAVPMKDSWRFNVAAYKLDRLLDLRMVPVSIQRVYKGKPAAFTWWVDDVMFEEVDRIKQGATAPDKESYARQLALSKVFDELIINIDRNLANLLITRSWNLVLIDHTRSFTPWNGIRNEAKLTRCSTSLLARMKALTPADVSATLEPLLTSTEVAALMGRRDRIVDFFERQAKSGGSEHVLFP